MSTNAVSYGAEDGSSFWGGEPVSSGEIKANLTFSTDGILQPGVLFNPGEMEHKWAIYFYNDNLIFVRSWLRQVFVTARTSQQSGLLIIESITGHFSENESPEFTIAILNFLLINYVMGTVVPAPLPADMADDLNKAGYWAFGMYGNKAIIGTFDAHFLPKPTAKLRSHSLLHIAVAKGNIPEIEEYFKSGMGIDSLAGDGLAPLHWALASKDTASLEKLLSLGADPNVRSDEGATPIMTAAPSNKTEPIKLLLEAGGRVNDQDNRGFTALHRAAEQGFEDVVMLLLNNGADKTVAVGEHTALSFAQAGKNDRIIGLLLQG